MLVAIIFISQIIPLFRVFYTDIMNSSSESPSSWIVRKSDARDCISDSTSLLHVILQYPSKMNTIAY